jgi:hypothetical protein
MPPLRFIPINGRVRDDNVRAEPVVMTMMMIIITATLPGWAAKGCAPPYVANYGSGRSSRSYASALSSKASRTTACTSATSASVIFAPKGRSDGHGGDRPNSCG